MRRSTSGDTPLSELGVIASFGATQALASVSESDGVVPSEIVTVTAAAHVDAPGEDHGPLNIITKHLMWRLRIADVDLSRLVLPDGFTETEWPGFEGSADLPPLSVDGGARWRRIPGSTVSRALIDEPSRFGEIGGCPAADGLRSFMVSDEVSPKYLETLRESHTVHVPAIGLGTRALTLRV